MKPLFGLFLLVAFVSVSCANDSWKRVPEYQWHLNSTDNVFDWKTRDNTTLKDTSHYFGMFTESRSILTSSDWQLQGNISFNIEHLNEVIQGELAFAILPWTGVGMSNHVFVCHLSPIFDRKTETVILRLKVKLFCSKKSYSQDCLEYLESIECPLFSTTHWLNLTFTITTQSHKLIFNTKEHTSSLVAIENSIPCQIVLSNIHLLSKIYQTFMYETRRAKNDNSSIIQLNDVALFTDGDYEVIINPFDGLLESENQTHEISYRGIYITFFVILVLSLFVVFCCKP